MSLFVLLTPSLDRRRQKVADCNSRSCRSARRGSLWERESFSHASYTAPTIFDAQRPAQKRFRSIFCVPNEKKQAEKHIMACRLSVGFVDVTLYSRNESTRSGDFEARRAIESAETLHLSVDGSDTLRRFLGRHTSGGYLSPDIHPSDVLRRLKHGVASGDIVAVSSARESRQAGSGRREEQPPRPSYATVTPSQLYRKAAPERPDSALGRVARSSQRLPAEDGPAMFRSMPGDLLPDGRIATPLTEGGSLFTGIMMTVAGAATGDLESDDARLQAMTLGDDSTPLGEASPFEYSEDSSLGNVLDLTARGVSEADEADCFGEYEMNLTMCEAARATFQDLRTLALCKERAFERYQACRGY